MSIYARLTSPPTATTLPALAIPCASYFTASSATRWLERNASIVVPSATKTVPSDESAADLGCDASFAWAALEIYALFGCQLTGTSI